MGKTVHFATGIGGLHDQYAAMCIAALSIMSEVARLCGKSGVIMRYTCLKGYLVPVAQDMIRSGYIQGGNPELYSDDMVNYTGENQAAFMAAVQGYMMREEPAVNMIFGALKAEAQQTLVAGARVGAVQLAGTPRLYYQALLVILCDYNLIGDELFAAGAYLSKDPAQLGTIQAQDWNKLIVMFLIILSAITSSFGLDLIGLLFSW